MIDALLNDDIDASTALRARLPERLAYRVWAVVPTDNGHRVILTDVHRKQTWRIDFPAEDWLSDVMLARIALEAP